MLAHLMVTPKTPDDWRQWQWAHRVSHDRIREALAAQGKTIQSQPLEPFHLGDHKSFLQVNESIHNDMNNALGFQNNNLIDTNWHKHTELAEWIDTHYQEHWAAEKALGL